MPEMDETYKQLNLDQKGWSLNRQFTYIGRSVSDDDFRELEGKKVMGVKVLHSQVTGEGLKYIAPEDLKFLSLTSQIFDEKGASLIPRFKMLRTIRIHASDKLTNKTIEYLLSPPELRSLEIRYTDKFPSKALSIISKSKRLVKLDIGKCSPISHDEFSKIADIKNLRIFRMPLTDIDDTYIDTVLKTKIEFLEVADSKISDRGLLKLAKLKSLKELTVNLYNSPITAVGLQKFHRRNPDVSIKVNDGPAIDSSYTKRGQSELEDLSERAQSSLRQNRKR